jgi:hypothetical protein
MNEVFNHDGTDKAGRVGLDAPRVRRSDAITLMVHHLMLAAMYFEATPDDITPSLDEIMDEANEFRDRVPKIRGSRLAQEHSCVVREDEG